MRAVRRRSGRAGAAHPDRPGPAPREPGRRGAGSGTVLAPVTERGEALGLLEMSLPARTGRRRRWREIARIAHVLAFVVIANRRHTDLFEWGQRSTPFTLPAEIQRRLLPAAFTCEAGSFTLSAWLEPAATVGGDTFDYSLGRDVLHLSLTDAMGHGVASALTATLCVGSLRNTRRQGGSLLEQAAAANPALSEHAADVAAESSPPACSAGWTCAPARSRWSTPATSRPTSCRGGHTGAVRCRSTCRSGLFADARTAAPTSPLEPATGWSSSPTACSNADAATLDLIAEIGRTRALHPRETTRRLTDMVLRVCRPRPGRRRHAARPGLARRPRPRPGHRRGRRPSTRQRRSRTTRPSGSLTRCIPRQEASWGRQACRRHDRLARFHPSSDPVSTTSWASVCSLMFRLMLARRSI